MSHNLHELGQELDRNCDIYLVEIRHELSASLHPFEFVPQIVCHLSGGQGGLSEHRHSLTASAAGRLHAAMVKLQSWKHDCFYFKEISHRCTV